MATFRQGWIALPLVLMVSLPTWSATAQNIDQLWTRCDDDNNADLSIEGCTAVIKSGLAGAALADAYFNRGNGYRKKGQRNRAIQDWDQAIRLNPKLFQAFYNRGNAYRVNGEYDRAIQDYNRVIRLNPTDGDAFANRGLSYYKKKDYDRAIADSGEAIRLNPKSFQAFYNRGLAYRDKGDNTNAIADFRRVLSIDPDHPYARDQLTVLGTTP